MDWIPRVARPQGGICPAWGVNPRWEPAEDPQAPQGRQILPRGKLRRGLSALRGSQGEEAARVLGLTPQAGQIPPCGRGSLNRQRCVESYGLQPQERKASEFPRAPEGRRQIIALARYTHRVAISNQRLVRLEGEEVTFTWKDYAEFLRRFLLHVLPERCVRIRYYGLLANRHREKALTLCREARRRRRS